MPKFMAGIVEQGYTDNKSLTRDELFKVCVEHGVTYRIEARDLDEAVALAHSEFFLADWTASGTMSVVLPVKEETDD